LHGAARARGPGAQHRAALEVGGARRFDPVHHDVVAQRARGVEVAGPDLVSLEDDPLRDDAHAALAWLLMRLSPGCSSGDDRDDPERVAPIFLGGPPAPPPSLLVRFAAALATYSR